MRMALKSSRTRLLRMQMTEETEKIHAELLNYLQEKTEDNAAPKHTATAGEDGGVGSFMQRLRRTLAA